MSTTQPWKDYAVIASIITTGYYLFVILRFYRFDIEALLKNHKHDTAKADSRQTDLDEPDPPQFSIETDQDWIDAEDKHTQHDSNEQLVEREETFSQLENLATRIKVDIGEAHEKEYSKAELILLLQMSLKEYPALCGPPFRYAIDNVIESECAKYGSIHLSENDKVMIWKQVD